MTELTFPRATRILEDRRSSICLVKHNLLNIASELSPAFDFKARVTPGGLSKATVMVVSHKLIASNRTHEAITSDAETALSIARVALARQIQGDFILLRLARTSRLSLLDALDEGQIADVSFAANDGSAPGAAVR